MLNSDSNQFRPISCGTITHPKVICHINDGRYKILLFITPLTEEQEDKLDSGKSIEITVAGKKVMITSINVKFYGEMNLSKDSEDYKTIAKSNILLEDFSGVRIPLHYDYENNVAYSDKGFLLINETFRPELVIQYYHGILGKPKRCAIINKRV